MPTYTYLYILASVSSFPIVFMQNGGEGRSVKKQKSLGCYWVDYDDIFRLCLVIFHSQPNKYDTTTVVLMFFLTVHHSIDLFHLPTLMHSSFIP